MGLTRRNLLSLGMLAAAGACGAHKVTRPMPRAWTGTKPRYYVLIILPGGIDAVLTTNPQRSRDVAKGVDVPYGEAEIFEAGRERFGPHLKSFERWLPSMTIINNIRTESVGHTSGKRQLRRLRTRSNLSQPTISELLVDPRDPTPLGVVNFGAGSGESSAVFDCMGSRFEGSPDICDGLDELTPEQLGAAADGFAQLRQRSTGTSEMALHSKQLEAFTRQLVKTPKFKFEKWGEETDPANRLVFGAPQIGPSERYLQRTLWLLENDLTTSVMHTIQAMEWDSHFRNADWQAKNSLVFFPLLAKFFDELHRRRNAHGTLADNTVVLVMSELGRYPYLNGDNGKDHFPETPAMLFGRRFPAGVFGATGRELEALPVDLATGRRHAKGHHMTLDDLGATLLSAFELDPLRFGYTGRDLAFLRRA